jgi:SAM-dependent methyltransferase
LSFDEHSADYSQKVDRALAVVGLEHDFFFEAKVRHIMEARRRLGACAADRSERQCWPSLGQPTLPAVPARLASGAVRVLEIGCGIGLLTQRLRPLFNDVWGIDPSIASLGQAATRDGRMIAADGLRTPFVDESFHMVIAVCVLHHVPVNQRAAFLAEASRITRRGGLVLLCEHNPWNPLTRLVVGRCELDRDAVLLAQPEARRRLAAAGLSNIRSRYILFFPWRGAVWRWLEARLAWLPLGGQYVIDAVRT